MKLENFTPKNEQKELTINKDRPIIEQLSSFSPEKDPEFTALKYLRDPEDIKRFYQERIAEYENDESHYENPAKDLLESLEHISRYGESYKKGWESFKSALASEISENIQKPKYIDPDHAQA